MIPQSVEVDKSEFVGLSMGKVKLTDICSPKQWKTIPTEQLTEDGYPVYGANGIIGKYSEYNHANPVIAITCRGATCGNINITQEKAYVTGNAMCLDDLCSDVDLEYLFYALRHYDFSTVISGSAQPQITRQGLSKVSVQLFPVDHQKFIAQTLAKAERIISHRRDQLAKLDELVKCRFVELFGEPLEVLKQGKTQALGTLVKEITVGYVGEAASAYTDIGIPYLRTQNVRRGYIDFAGLIYVTELFHTNNTKSKVSPGDVVISRVGVNRGMAAKIPDSLPEANIANCLIIKKSDAFNSDYLIFYLNLSYGKHPQFGASVGSAQGVINTAILKKWQVLQPELEQQNAFADFVHRIDKLRIGVQAALDKAQTLFDSLMQEYFG